MVIDLSFWSLLIIGVTIIAMRLINKVGVERHPFLKGRREL